MSLTKAWTVFSDGVAILYVETSKSKEWWRYFANEEPTLIRKVTKK